MGRRKIEMKLIKENNSKQVTFSKRRNGMFKKANEIATLCALQVAIVVFSPGGKAYSFGHPTVDSVVGRFLQETNRRRDAIHGDADSYRQTSSVERLSRDLANLLKQLEDEKKKEKSLDKAVRAKGGEKYLKSIDKLSQDELIELKQELEAARENLKARAIEIEASSTLLLMSKNAMK